MKKIMEDKSYPPTSTMNDPKVRDLWERCEKHGIVADCNKRWEGGVPHHPEAERIMELVMESDWAFMDDYFCWKKGGDGDNGETLMFALSVLLELRDAEENLTNTVEAAVNELKKLACCRRCCGEDDYAVRFGIEAIINMCKAMRCEDEVIREFNSIDDDKCKRLTKSYWHLIKE